MIPTDDRGLTLGDGLFETLLARRGELILLDEHLARMAAGAAALGLPAPDQAEAGRLAKAALAGRDEPRCAVRISFTAGSGGRGLDRPASPQPRPFAAASAAPRPEAPVRLATSDIRRNPTSPAARHKTLAYLDNVLARRGAVAAGADDALMLDTAGHVACAAAANIFWIANGRLETPSLDCGILAGVMRAQVIGAAHRLGLQVAECAVGGEHLAAAQGVFLTNSLVGVRPASEIDGRAAPAHPWVGRLAEAVAPVA